MIKFKIDHIDFFGQGVSKIDKKITFIPKTLPEEEGTAQVYASKKGVQFAQLVELTKSSPYRIDPTCPHYQQCQGCHFQHTTYEQELAFKETTLKFIIKKLFPHTPNLPVNIISAKQRLNYRNRIQLHYDKKNNSLGFIDKTSHQVIAVPNCCLPLAAIGKKLQQLYLQDSWQQLVQEEKTLGHLEIYQQIPTAPPAISINRPYAEAGFSQVNEEVNQKLQKEIGAIIDRQGTSPQIDTILDLFGGNGNLVKQIKDRKIYTVDANIPPKMLATSNERHLFISQDLYHLNAIDNLRATIGKKIDLIIIDPPRSGQKDLLRWVETFLPRALLYVSCNAQTMARDLAGIIELGLHPKELWLIDLFPATHHFETAIFLTKKI